MNLFYKNDVNPLTMGELIVRYPIREFLSPKRSTVNMLSFMQTEAFDAFLNGIDIDISKAKFHCEYPVPVQNGTASATDVMIVCDNRLIAVEAKNIEGSYDKVHKWIDTKTRENKRKVLQGWITLINLKAGTNIEIDDVQDITYQMIHRLASACIDETKNPEMIYLYFGNNQRMMDYYNEQINTLRLLVEDRIKIGLHIIEGNPTADMRILLQRWDNRERDLRAEVIAGLRRNSLYTF